MNKPKRGRQWENGFSISIEENIDLADNKDHISVTDKTYSELKRMILYDILAPGIWLRQDILTRQLGVSRTPVREALRALNREGLIEIIPNYGAKVSDLSMDEFEEIYAIRKGIEGLAARRSVIKLSFEKLKILRNMYESLIPMADNKNLTQYLKEEWHFRYWLYEVACSERFLTQIKALRERAERYLRYAYTFEHSIIDSLEFHHELLIACENGNPQQAEKIVQKALNWTIETAGPIIANRLQNS
jgi:DNA-binding GntR family transcriptional regulator